MLSFWPSVIVTGVPILIIVASTEYLWRKKQYHNEFTRKFIHITVGTYAAFWPWFISYRNIELLALGALCALFLSRKLNIFQSMHLARAYGTGEFLSTIAIGLTAFVTHDNWIYAVSILHLSLADGLAAIIGTKYGQRSRYKVFGYTKSIVGSLTFWLVSATLLSVFVLVQEPHFIWPAIIWLPPLAMVLENIGVQGADNVLVPLLIATVLNVLA